jgi:hypothetical protein
MRQQQIMAVGEGFLEKRPPPQANRMRIRRRRCSAGNRSQACGRGDEDGDGDSRSERLQGPRPGTESAAPHRVRRNGGARQNAINQPTGRPQHRVPGVRIPS